MQAQRPRYYIDEIESAREALRQARQRLTEYAALMNSPAGQTGLTTHQVLWGDFTRAAPPAPVPPSAMEFRFADPLAIDRFKLTELIGAGKALDDQAATMGDMGEPTRQPWRGIGNLNLSRFDRESAIEAVGKWAATLDSLHQLIRKFSSTSCWNGLESINDVTIAIKAVSEFPDPENAIEHSILPLAAEDICRQSLASWANLALTAHELELQAATVCRPDELSREDNFIQNLFDQANTLNIADAPTEALPKLLSDAQTLAEHMARSVELLARVLEMAGRNSNTQPDIKAEAMAVGFLRLAQQLPRDKAHYRSAALAESVAPIHELRVAGAILLSAGFFERLFGRDWRTQRRSGERHFQANTRWRPERRRGDCYRWQSGRKAWQGSMQTRTPRLPPRGTGMVSPHPLKLC
jgi:hypothetical protein